MLSLSLLVLAAAPQAPELGRVHWLRDLDEGLARARVTGRPVLLLFNEVPGCQTVLGFGRDVLSDDAVVSRVERDFVPVAIFNNIDGKDRHTLEAFGEPAWNNPVVRLLDADRRPLAPRFEGPYTKEAFERLLDARAAPLPSATERLTVAVGCFWECEARLGELEAVRASRVGHLEGDEVVELEFDPRVSSREALVRAADAKGCAQRVFSRSSQEHALVRALVGRRAVRTDEPLAESAKDTKFYLKGRDTFGRSEQELVRLNAAARAARGSATERQTR